MPGMRMIKNRISAHGVIFVFLSLRLRRRERVEPALSEVEGVRGQRAINERLL